MGGPEQALDIIGDIHGCYDELCALLEKLGCSVVREVFLAKAPPGRTVVFLGDFCDKGPKNSQVLRLVSGMIRSGDAAAVLGNHDDKLLRGLRGANVSTGGGLELTLEDVRSQGEEFCRGAAVFLEELGFCLTLDSGRLVVAHAGLKESLQGSTGSEAKHFCLYGDVDGTLDGYGLPVRRHWEKDYRGEATVVFGHTPVPAASFVGNTVNIDTGCVYGGSLTALRYPEMTIVDVRAQKEYAQPLRPFR